MHTIDLTHDCPVEWIRELPGWELCWARLVLTPSPDREGLADLRTTALQTSELRTSELRTSELRTQVAATARQRFRSDTLADHPTVAAIRQLFRAAGTDPTRYRPSSEALLRRVLKGEELPAIHPLVDLNNCLSVELAVPSCVMAEGSFTPPITLRAGRPGESYLSLRGPFNLEGKPLLADAQGPLGTPITDSERVKVQATTQAAWLVAYLPAGEVSVRAAHERLAALVERAPVATLSATVKP